MEKLKVKHDHSLTDILKVLIFTLILLIPGFMFLPSMLYFGFNEQANAPTKEAEIKEIVNINFNQQYKINFGSYTASGVTITPYVNEGYVELNGIVNTGGASTRDYPFTMTSKAWVQNHIYIWGAYTQQTGMNSYIINLGGTWRGAMPFTREKANGNATNNAFNLRVANGTEFINVKIYPQIFDLTLMFGEGNEPTLQEFQTYLPNTYYPYTENEEVLIERTIGTETVVDITTQLNYNWQKIWNMPILSWTNHTILLYGIKAFTGVFGIVDTSYITNLLTYELIMVGVYIVIDIVLTLFKWLTHMIGNK